MCQECDEISKMESLASTFFSQMDSLTKRSSSLVLRDYLNGELPNMEKRIGSSLTHAKNLLDFVHQRFDT